MGGQQHGMVCLDAARRGGPSGAAVERHPLGRCGRRAGRRARATATRRSAPGAGPTVAGSVPVASLTVTKLRWLADHEPEQAARVAAVALPHDWLTWRLAGAGVLDALVHRPLRRLRHGLLRRRRRTVPPDLLALALRRDEVEVVARRVLAPAEAAGHGDPGAVGAGHLLLGPGLRRQRRRCPRTRAECRPESASRSAPPAWSRRSPTTPTARRHRPRRRIRRRHRRTSRWPCTLNGARVLDAAAGCSGSTTTSWPAWPWPRPRCGRPRARAVPRGRAHPEPARRDRATLHGMTLAT